MAGAAGGELAGQVSAAGGFGFMSAGYGATVDDFTKQFAIARSSFQTADSVHSPATQFPIGVGYLAWQLEQPESTLVDLLPVALDHNVQAVWFAFGENLAQWIQFVRDHDKRSGNGKKTLIFVQISTVKEAVIAVNEWKVDCVVAQGVESGGHGASHALPLLNLLPSILAAVPVDSPPILAAGGLVNGGHLAAVLTLGASGAVLGTRFLLASASLYSDAQREALIGASSEMSVRSMAWDYARGTLGWPAGIDGRGLRNVLVEDFEKGVNVETLQSKFREGIKTKNLDYGITWAGSGVGQMSKTQSAKSIVEEIHRESISHLDSAAQLYS
ncbi:2-nitropropane dioxygenase [Mycena filopes]|nr:2-nitropropane dioxygenase [Mycena filopes]